MAKENGHSNPERQALLELERCRIEDILTNYIRSAETAEIGEQLIAWAMELDDVAEAILKRPSVREEFSYDGIMFTRHDPERSGFYMSRDGLHFLQIFDETNLPLFFEKNKWSGGRKGFLEWTEKNFVNIPKIRLENLEKEGHISLFDPNEIQEMVSLAFYEEQMQE